MSQTDDLADLLSAVEKLASYDFHNDNDKRKAMLATRAVSDRLQRPIDKIMEMWGSVSYSNSSPLISIRLKFRG